MNSKYILFSSLLATSALVAPIVQTASASTDESIQQMAEFTINHSFKDSHLIQKSSYIPISYLVNQKVINGIKDTKDDIFFNPNDPLTRAQAATIFVKGLQLKLKSGTTYVDITKHWAEEQITIATTANLMNGKSSTIFAPEDYLTIAETSTILARAFNLESSSDISHLKDVNNHWAKANLAKVVAAGILTDSNGYLNPDKKVTREQFSVMFYKAFEAANKLKPTQIKAEVHGLFPIDVKLPFHFTDKVQQYEIDLYISNEDQQLLSGHIYYVNIGDEEKYTSTNPSYDLISRLFNMPGEDIQILQHVPEGNGRKYTLSTSDKNLTASVQPATEEILKEAGLSYLRPTPMNVADALPKAFNTNLNFAKDGRAVEVNGLGEKTFKIAYNGKVDTITLSGKFSSTEELFNEINRQTNNTGVKVEILYPTYISKYPRFTAPSFVKGSTIEIIGAEDIFGEIKSIKAYYGK